MSEYLPTPVAEQGRYAAATFDLFQASTDAPDDLAAHAKSERTIKGYRSDRRQFRAWAGGKGIEVPRVVQDRVELGTEAIPPAMLMLYLADVQGEPKAHNRYPSSRRHPALPPSRRSGQRAGLDPTGYSAHSLRAGFVSECDRRHIPNGAVRAVTRHTSDARLAVYDRPGELFSGSAGAYFEGV